MRLGRIIQSKAKSSWVASASLENEKLELPGLGLGTVVTEKEMPWAHPKPCIHTAWV